MTEGHFMSEGHLFKKRKMSGHTKGQTNGQMSGHTKGQTNGQNHRLSQILIKILDRLMK